MSEAAIAGYEALDASWINKTEAISPKDLYRHVLDLFPQPLKRRRVLDLGAGTGRDASWLARLGAIVTAVEPAANLRTAGQHLHRGIPITWIDDRFPALATLPQDYTADLILVTGVWQHLNAVDQPLALRRCLELLAPGGRLVLALRHGAAAPHHINFPIDTDMLTALAEASGVSVLRRHEAQSLGTWNKNQGVEWTWLVLEKAQTA